MNAFARWRNTRKSTAGAFSDDVLEAVDGFNLSYGAVKDTPYKWLDLHKLCTLIFPKNELHRIRYFTALVKNTSADPTKSQRQQTFIRALETLPGLTVHYGSFLASKVRMPLVRPLPGRRTAHVVKMEEKGSDVNLISPTLPLRLDPSSVAKARGTQAVA